MRNVTLPAFYGANEQLKKELDPLIAAAIEAVEGGISVDKNGTIEFETTEDEKKQSAFYAELNKQVENSPFKGNVKFVEGIIYKFL